jgi:outer membrane protein OmpA-like peptidoglycan-associated protein
MNGKFLITLAALLGLILFAGWNYTERHTCCKPAMEGETGLATDPGATMPHWFTGSNDINAKTGDLFPAFADGAVKDMSSTDRLGITGYYYNTEDSTKGLARANALAARFIEYNATLKGKIDTKTEMIGEDLAVSQSFAGAKVYLEQALPKLKANSDTTTSIMKNGKLVVYFPTGSTKNLFDVATEKNIASIVEMAKSGKTFEISGHTDNVGNPASNKSLSINRADKLKAILVERGVKANSIKTIGMGQEEPIADNGTSEGKSLNRRAEVLIK